MPTFRRTLAATLAAIVAALLFALAPAATAKPKPPQPPPRPERLIDPATESDPVFRKMLQYREWYRTTFKISPGSNVAVFHFKYPNGAEGYWAIHSDPAKNTEQAPKGHSERRAFRIMTQLGIDTDTVDKTLSELETCTLPRRDCKGLMAREFRKTEIGRLNPYPEDKAVRDASMKAHKAANRDLVRQFEQSKQIMNPGGGRQGGGGALPRMLGSGRLGGIDFSSLELRYVSDKGGDLGYSFRAPSTATPGDAATGLETARQSSDAFFTWLALPPQSFWVNLNPSQPDRIIDPQLARTDVGRVLLDADMVLKRTAVNLTRPDTALGDQYWDELERLYGDRAPEACWSARVWIVPGTASVRDSNDELYILDAPLTVKMVSEEIVDPAVGRPGCPAEPPPVEAAKAELFQRLILPHMIDAVNTAPEYAALRRVYLARVAAEWFRQRSGEHPTAVSKIANSGDVSPWLARTPWNPMDIFNQMLTSTRNGEWTVERDVQAGGQMYKRTLIYGGVDFSQTPRQSVSRADFKAHYPRLAKQARQAQVEAAADTDQHVTWIGGGDDRPPITSASGAPLDQLAVGLGIRGPRRVHAGRQVRYRLRVSNLTPAAVHDVQVCDRLSSELVFVRANRPRRVRDGRSCWQIPRIAGGRSTDISVTARVLDGARGSMRDTATASMLGRSDVTRIRQQRTFRVQTGAGAQPAPAPRPAVSRAESRIAGALAVSAALGLGALAPGPALAAAPPAAIAPPSRADGATTARIAATTNARPRPGGRRRVARLTPLTDWSRQAQTLLVLDGAWRAERQWLKVRLPIRPKGVTGWILRSKALLGHTPYWVDLRLRSRRLTVYRDGKRIRSVRAVIGAPGTPTPRGLAAIYERNRQPDPAGFLGPWALSLTALSDVLESYGGGPGRVAIHGRGGASLRDPFGSARSHGCVRIDNGVVDWLARQVTPGTPVDVRR